MPAPDVRPRNLGPMRWTIHGERSLYDSEWLRLVLVDIEVPGGRDEVWRYISLRRLRGLHNGTATFDGAAEPRRSWFPEAGPG